MHRGSRPPRAHPGPERARRAPGARPASGSLLETQDHGLDWYNASASSYEFPAMRSRDVLQQPEVSGHCTDRFALQNFPRHVRHRQSTRNTPSPNPPQSAQRSRAVSPPPHVLGQIVEMGFSIQQARVALAATDTGLDVQAALEMLLSNGVGSSSPAPEQEGRRKPQREPGHERYYSSDEEHAASPPQRQRPPARSPPQAERSTRDRPAREGVMPSSESQRKLQEQVVRVALGASRLTLLPGRLVVSIPAVRLNLEEVTMRGAVAHAAPSLEAPTIALPSLTIDTTAIPLIHQVFPYLPLNDPFALFTTPYLASPATGTPSN
ncbi:hypothetical protein NUW54_g10428 [Trametes sanguinea]|uniref:Uncharacterized protein n=1 Tax=Trametes sanguinea TaxID=158606 RepID=A0ACC1NZC2_9APHY|nr:hypothetical protein NUW54_g10428 [Trametes sanguinea]